MNHECDLTLKARPIYQWVFRRCLRHGKLRLAKTAGPWPGALSCRGEITAWEFISSVPSIIIRPAGLAREQPSSCISDSSVASARSVSMTRLKIAADRVETCVRREIDVRKSSLRERSPSSLWSPPNPLGAKGGIFAG